MQRTGTWSAPLLCSSIPPNKAILHPHISFWVIDTTTPNTYEFQGLTCTDGSKLTQYLDFHDSYSPVGSTDSVRLLLALSATYHLTLHVLNISYAFQNSIIFDPDEQVYLSQPTLYLDWFRFQWPDYTLPSQEPTNLAIQCLKSIQGTCGAGWR